MDLIHLQIFYVEEFKMDVHFNAMKIKFDELNELTKPILNSSRLNTVNIFINLDDVNFRFRNVRSNQEFQCCGAGAFKQYASNVFNLAAHYRQWAFRKGMSSKIYIYYTTAMGGFSSNVLVNGYRSRYVDDCNVNNSNCFYVNNTIDAAGPFMKQISEYIDGVYIIDTKSEEPSVLPYLISMEKPADWNFVISKDRVELQYALYDKFSILYPSTSYGARLINNSNLWNFISMKEYISSPYVNNFDPRLYFSILGVVGDGKRSVPKVKRIGWKSIFDYLDEIWEKNRDHSIYTMIDALEEKISAKGTDAYNTFKNNLLALSMKSRYESISIVNKEYIMMQLIDMIDYESLNQMNRDPALFANWPINIAFLTEQTGTVKKKNIWNV